MQSNDLLQGRSCPSSVMPSKSKPTKYTKQAHRILENSEQMAAVDALQILNKNIVAMDRCPAHDRTLWRQAIAETNNAGSDSSDLIR